MSHATPPTGDDDLVRLRRLADALPTGVMQVDGEHRVVFANPRLTQILGSASGTALDDHVEPLVPADRARLVAAVVEALGSGAQQELEVEVSAVGDREARRCAATVVAVTGPRDAREALVSLHDVTATARVLEEERERASHDALTGCLNRDSVILALGAALEAARGALTGVVCVDLDEFARLNETFGRAVGDEMLLEVAERIGTVLRGGDHVGRLGADEFLVVCPDLADPDQVTAIAERLRERLSGPVALSEGIVGLRASIGVAIGSPGTSADDLAARADAAMHVSKGEGRGRVVLG
ncbi:diguanylate cyclase [Actinotalea sp. M2MS4P-6]|uniref:GGDEF domain-containing protein n=1 Tax=Actinotalea sp. M2MS4P-6 TaxID=2983762 RepID=UPI0021E510A1|nr:diguanylate cyclase [Actinotalea sp. M2MS4P-6]MCV2395762.1 diguanylate cyclase [Actinotalea sp. M2MS4P-6]